MPSILVIDDQNDVRAMMSIVLRVNHFEVTEAASAAAGLQAFDARDFDVAIVDVFLQDANGLDVIAAMRERVPDMPVVAVSGMTELDPATQPAELSDVVSLRKPFRPNELIRAIETARASVRNFSGARASVAGTAG